MASQWMLDRANGVGGDTSATPSTQPAPSNPIQPVTNAIGSAANSVAKVGSSFLGGLGTTLNSIGSAFNQGIQQTFAPQIAGAKAVASVANRVVNTPFSTQAIPFVGPVAAGIQTMQNPKVPPTSTLKGVYNTAIAPLYQAPLRAAAEIKKSYQQIVPQSPVDKEVTAMQEAGAKRPLGQKLSDVAFGNGPIKSFQEQSKEGVDVPGIGSVKGAGAYPFIAGSTALSLLPQGGEAKPAERELISLAKQAGTVEEFASLVEKASPEIKSVLETAIKDAKNPIEAIGQFFKDASGSATKVVQGEVPVLGTNIVGSPGEQKLLGPGNPVQRVIDALKSAQPLRNEQEALYSATRKARFSAAQQAGQAAGGGEAGFSAELGALKGEMPKVDFSGIRGQLSQSDVDSLHNMVSNSPDLLYGEKLAARNGLANLLGESGGTVPTNSQLELLSKVFPKEFINTVMEKRSAGQKVIDMVTDVLNVPRSVMATLDLSAPLRQGAFLVGRPKEFIPALKDMFKAATSEDGYKEIMAGIQSKETYPMMREADLALTDAGGILSNREESFMSNIAEKIPGLGRFVQGSNRGYTAFLNKLRADTFESIYNGAKDSGALERNPNIAGDIAKFVNSATGRGDLGRFSRAAGVLNGALFSPRLLASRLNLLNPTYYASLDPYVRKEALKSLVTFAATGLTVLGLAKAGGAEVGTDPNSADFGKIKVGNTRFDIWGGFQQPIVLAARLISGKMTNSTTGQEMSLGEGYKPTTRKDIIERFFESKESPIASFVLGLLNGQDATGQPFNVPAEVVDRFVPLIAQDLYSLSQEHGPAGLLMGVPGIFGVGSQTYGSEIPSMGTTPSGKKKVQYTPVPGLGQTIVNKISGNPDSNIPPEQRQKFLDIRSKQLKKKSIPKVSPQEAQSIRARILSQ